MKPKEVVKIEAVAGAGELLDGALGIGLRHALDIGRLDLVAEGLLDRLAALVVLVAPAEIADRPDIDEADLELSAAPTALPAVRARAAAPAEAPIVFHVIVRAPSVWIATFVQVSAPVLQLAPVEQLLTGPAQTASRASPERRWRGRGGSRGGGGPGSSRGRAPPTGPAKARRTAPPGRAAAARSRRRKYRRRPAAQAGRQAAKTTSASAIQPRPAVMPGDQKRV